MKTNIKIMTILSLIALFSCSKDDAVDNEEVTFTITGFSASLEGQDENSLKNYFVYDTTISPHVYHNWWNPDHEKEKVTVMATEPGGYLETQPANFTLSNVYSDTKTASFKGGYSFQGVENAKISLYALYPACFGNDPSLDVVMGNVNMKFPEKQKSTSDGGLENTPMFAYQTYILSRIGLPTEPVFEFKNLAAFLRFNVTGMNAKNLDKIEAIMRDATPRCNVGYDGEPTMTPERRVTDRLTITLDCSDRVKYADTMSYMMAIPFYSQISDGNTYIKFKFLDKSGIVIKETKDYVGFSVRRSFVKKLNIELN